MLIYNKEVCNKLGFNSNLLSKKLKFEVSLVDNLYFKYYYDTKMIHKNSTRVSLYL